MKVLVYKQRFWYLMYPWRLYTDGNRVPSHMVASTRMDIADTDTGRQTDHIYTPVYTLLQFKLYKRISHAD